MWPNQPQKVLSFLFKCQNFNLHDQKSFSVLWWRWRNSLLHPRHTLQFECRKVRNLGDYTSIHDRWRRTSAVRGSDKRRRDGDGIEANKQNADDPFGTLPHYTSICMECGFSCGVLSIQSLETRIEALQIDGCVGDSVYESVSVSVCPNDGDSLLSLPLLLCWTKKK